MFDYKIIRSNRKTVGIKVTQQQEVIVRIPNRFPAKKVPSIVENHREWIEKAIAKQSEKSDYKCELSDEDIEKLKQLAKSIIPSKVEKFAKIMGAKPTGVKITSAKTRFGSCNAKNSLCFSYILMLYPDEAVNYVVVHELAHTFEHNHSQKFYEKISEFITNYKYCEKLLKKSQKKPF